MTSWIPFGKGNYFVADAFLMGKDGRAASVDNAIVEVYEDSRGNRQLRGSGFIVNSLLVELLEENDTLDLVLDMGESVTFCLEDPALNAGKVFAANVRSVCHFAPSQPGRMLEPAALDRLVDTLVFIDENSE